jgi:hypothetical protein
MRDRAKVDGGLILTNSLLFIFPLFLFGATSNLQINPASGLSGGPWKCEGLFYYQFRFIRFLQSRVHLLWCSILFIIYIIPLSFTLCFFLHSTSLRV